MKKLTGRPDVLAAEALKKEMWEHFLAGDSPIFTAEESGVNIKTVYSYYHEFREKLVEHDIDDFVTKQRCIKELAIAGLDRDLKRMEDETERMKKLADDDIENADWSRLLHSLLKTIADIRQQKASLEMTPTLDISLEELVKEFAEDEREPGNHTSPKD